jgi:hypothetical protein
VQWKDVTSYSRDDKERIPSSFETRAGDLRITVTRHIHYPPDVWLLSVAEYSRLNLIELRSRDLADAQAEALTLVRTRLHEALAAMGE